MIVILAILYTSSLLRSVLGDCQSQGCSDDMRSNSICDTACMISDCNFDTPVSSTNPSDMTESKCYNSCISKGCGDAQLGNSQCDEGKLYLECNILECGFDWGKCIDCSACASTPNDCIYPNCEDNECKLRFSGCSQIERFLAFANQVIRDDFGYKTSPSECYTSTSCTSDKLTGPDCAKECNIEACAFHVGKCFECDSSCELCYKEHEKTACLTCANPDKYLYRSICVSGCLQFHKEVTQIFKNPMPGDPDLTIKLCIPSGDTSSKLNPQAIYVTSNTSLDSTDSDGSCAKPYTNLALALSEIHHKYTTIYLLNYLDSAHNLEDYNTDKHPYTHEYAEESDPLNIYNFTPENIEIKPLRLSDIPVSCITILQDLYYQGDTKALLKWTGQKAIRFTVKKELVIYDLDIDGGNTITSGKCTNCNETYLFYLIAGKLELNNVIIQNWKAQFNSLIFIEGSESKPQLVLKSVDFKNLRGSQTGKGYAIIELDSKNCDLKIEISCGGILYEKGHVSLLDNGYQLNESLFFLGFIYAQYLDKLEITGVTFEYNLAYEGKSDSNILDNGLIYIDNFTSIMVKSCNFTYNRVTAAIFNIELDMPFEETQGVEFTIKFEGNTFSNNYGALITFSSENKQPKIEFITNSFNNNYLKDDKISMIQLEIQEESEDESNSSDSVKFTDATIKECYTSSNLLHLMNMKNVEFVNLNITSSLEKEGSDYVNELVNNYFVNNQNSEIKTLETSISGIELHGGYSLYLDGVTNISFKNLILDNNYSSKGCTNILIQGLKDKLYINQANFTNNTCDKCNEGGIGIKVEDVKGTIEIFNLYASNNSAKEGYGVLYLSSNSEAYLKLSDSIISSTTSKSAAGAFLQLDDIIITKVEFLSNCLEKDKTAVLHIDPPAYSPKVYINISHSNFHSNSNTLTGAALYITNSLLKDEVFTLNINNCDFDSNSSSKTDGAALYIASSVRLNEISSISKCSFTQNISARKGNISLNYISGSLSFHSCTFSDNKASEGVVFDVSIGESNLDITYSNFYYNSATSNKQASLIHLSDSTQRSRLKTNNCTFERNKASIVELEFDDWVDTGSTFNYNDVYQAAVLYAKERSDVQILFSTISSNTSKDNGGALVLSGSSTLNLKGCKLSNNTSKMHGGVIYMEQNSIIIVENSYLFHNKSDLRGSVIYSIGCMSSKSSIQDSYIYENTTKDMGTIILINSDLTISDSYIYSNESQVNSSDRISGIVVILSYVSLFNTEFRNMTSESGGSLYVTTISTAEITGCTFKDSSVTAKGGAIYSAYSTILVHSSNFINLSAESGGAGIYTNSDSYVTIMHSNFHHCTSNRNKSGSAISSQDSSIIIAFSYFERSTKSAIRGIDLKSLNITDSKFIYGTGFIGGALVCEDCMSVILSNDIFYNNTADDVGGAVYFTNSKRLGGLEKYEVYQCEFINNIADSGGAIYAENIDMTISNSEFYSNQAVDSDGGGVYLQCPDRSEYNCEFRLTNNKFENNTAKRNGGAISWLNSKPVIEDNTYKDNYARYGNNTACFGSVLKLVDDTFHPNKYREPRDLEDQVDFSGIAPSQNINLITLVLLDEYNQVVNTDTTISIQLNGVGDTDVTRPVIISDEGYFYMYNFTIKAAPGSTIQLNAISNGMTHEISNAFSVRVIDHIIITVALRDCIIGEIKHELACEECKWGQYSLNPDDKECKDCPSEAICNGGAEMAPKPGYWRMDKYTDTFYKCLNPDACLGSSDIVDLNYSGDCADGYKGNLCQSCADGYSRTAKNECGLCPEPVSNGIKLAGIMIGVVIVCIIMVKTTLDSAYKQKSLQSIYIKIFLNYLQLVTLTASFDLDWPQYVLEMFTIQESAGNATDQIFSIDCFMNDKTGLGFSSDDVYYIKLISMLLLPVIILLASMLVWIWISLYHKTLKYFKSEFLATLVILLFLVHPNIVKSMFSAFSCLDIEGDKWLKENLDIKCWDSKHSSYVMSVALPGIVVWGLGIPTICLFYLVKYRRRLDNISVRLKFGFLFNGYKRTRFYWEFVILYRKIIIVFCSVFLSTFSIPVQALTVMIVLLISLHIQNRCDSYNDRRLNEMEVRSILVAAITIYCGLYYLTGDLSELAKIAFFVMIVASNSYFLYYWIFRMLEVSLSILLYRIPCLRRKFARMNLDGFDEMIFIESAMSQKVIKREGEIILSLYCDKIQREDRFRKEPDLEYLYHTHMKDMYMDRVRFKNMNTEDSHDIGNIINTTIIEESLYESVDKSISDYTQFDPTPRLFDKI